MKATLSFVAVGVFVGCGAMPDDADAIGVKAADSVSSAIQNGTEDVGSVVNDAVVGIWKRIDPIPGLGNSGGTQLVCTGTLISSTWVLTAAHCVEPEWDPTHMWIAVGVDIQTATSLAVDDCFMHPLAYGSRATPWRCGIHTRQATPDDLSHDLALIHLTQAVPRTVARPMRVALRNPRASYTSWINEPVTIRGWGRVADYGSASYFWPAVRRVGQNVLDAPSAGLGWLADLTTPTGVVGALPRKGDSGGALIWYPTSSTPTLLGVASFGRENTNAAGQSIGSYQAGWSNPSLPAASAWITSVMTHATEASAQVLTPPSAPVVRWQGEGQDAADNCPGIFNPWQADSDNDGIGDECDLVPSAQSAWGSAAVSATGQVSSQWSAAGAPILVTSSALGSYTVSMKQLGRSGGNVQVVASGKGNARCKVSQWRRSGSSFEHMDIEVRCHDPLGGAAASGFVVLLSHGSNAQSGAYVYYSGANPFPDYSWNSTGGSNSVVRVGVGRYQVSYPGISATNLAMHVTAYGAGAEYCKLEGWGSASAGVACYAAGGAATDTSFSFLLSTAGAARAGLVGGHAWVSGGTAPTAYQMIQPFDACSAAPAVSVTGVSSVTYPSTVPLGGYPSFPLTTAYGRNDSGYCKIESWGSEGTATTARTQCFNALGAPTDGAFTQSLTLAVTPGPC